MTSAKVSAMVRTGADARRLLHRHDYQAEAAAFLARAAGYTSREAVLCSLMKAPSAKHACTYQETSPDGLHTYDSLDDDDLRHAAICIHLERCGAPVFPSWHAQRAYTRALEAALQNGLTPVPARDAALCAVGDQDTLR